MYLNANHYIKIHFLEFHTNNFHVRWWFM